jgi:hypothetical protein
VAQKLAQIWRKIEVSPSFFLKYPHWNSQGFNHPLFIRHDIIVP